MCCYISPLQSFFHIVKDILSSSMDLEIPIKVLVLDELFFHAVKCM
jgi:hypothetical protein